jgi:hypothetical protein
MCHVSAILAWFNDSSRDKVYCDSDDAQAFYQASYWVLPICCHLLSAQDKRQSYRWKVFVVPATLAIAMSSLDVAMRSPPKTVSRHDLHGRRM